MELLLHMDPRTLEPLGVWRVVLGDEPDLFYAEDDALKYAQSVVAESSTANWPEFAQYLTERTPGRVWWELVESNDGSPADMLDRLRREWAGVASSTTSPRFAAAARRIRFRRFHGRSLATKVLGSGALEFEADRRVSATISLWRSANDDRLVAIVGPGEKQLDIDAALAYGLTFQGDRDLHMVLPGGDFEIRGVGSFPVATPTLQRVAYLRTPVFVWTYFETGQFVWDQRDLDVTQEIIPPRHQVADAARLDDELKIGVHGLGARNSWIDELRHLAEEEMSLDASHRLSYLSWHHSGRQVLKAQASTAGVRITAGTDYSAHRADKPMARVIELAGPATSAELADVADAIKAAIAERAGGEDQENMEHLLQSRLATEAGVAQLRLVGDLEREVPATRPGQQRAFIDLLGLDAKGDIHVIETKLGPDPMLSMQGLDYWSWATAYRDVLVTVLRDRGHEVSDDARIRLDYVVGTKSDSGKPPDLRYLAPQLEALDGGISWRVGIATGWRGESANLAIEWSNRREIPDAAKGHYEPRFANRLQAHLIDYFDQRASRRRQLFLDDAAADTIPSAQPTYHRLADAGLLHGFVSHIRSSQYFAINLFGGLEGDALVALAQRVVPGIVSVSRVDLEFMDPRDHLGESSASSRHKTQADVAISAVDGGGRRHLILVEVKLTEDDFGHCTGYEDADNHDLDPCSRSAAFGGDTDACFKLLNHDRGGRRTYDLYVTATAESPIAGCPFRRSINQPMRNVALARALVDAGEYDSATVALCAHNGHAAIWRRWEEAKQSLLSDEVTFADLPASLVLRDLDPRDAARLAERYDLPYDPDDRGRLLAALERALAMMQRVSSDGGVLTQLQEVVVADEDLRTTSRERALAQRLELLSESTRSARADLVFPLLDEP